LASGSDDSTIRIWDLSAKKEIRILTGHHGAVTQVAFSVDGQLLASASEDHTVRIWDPNSGKELQRFDGNTSGVLGVAISPDQRLIASCGNDHTVRVWDIHSQKELRTLREHTATVRAVAFSPDGQLLASGAQDHTVKIWSLSSAESLCTLLHPTEVYSLAFSPNGSRLASGSYDGSVRLWDTVTFDELISIPGLGFQANSLAFAPEARSLLSGEEDGTIKVWDGTLLGPERSEERESLRLLKYWFEREEEKDRVFSRIREDRTVSESVRQRALLCLDGYAAGLVHLGADRFLLLQDKQTVLKEDLPSIIRVDRTINSLVKHEALRQAENYVEDLDALKKSCRVLVKQGNPKSDAYQSALRLANRACQLAPEDSWAHTLLGIAHYRLANYADALKALEHADKLKFAEQGNAIPADLAFLAMAQRQLGQKEAAKKTFDRLREVMNKPEWANDTEAQSFFREGVTFFEAGATESGKK
jgi:hypothetical protein